MPFWSRPAAVGLDIGSRLVKVVQLQKNGKNIELEKFGVSDIYPDSEKPQDAAAQKQAVITAIGKAMEMAGISSNQVVTAVAGESIIVRYIQLPVMPESELTNAIRWEAEEFIPFQIDDVNIDSAIIGYTGEGDTRQMDVLLVCARKDLINEQVNLLDAAELQPTIVDVDSFAFLNCFDLNYDPAPDDIVGLVNIGGDITTISVYKNGMPRFSRDISIGGSTVSSAIQQRLGISVGEAETMKIQRGVPEDGGGDSQAGEGGMADTIRSTVEAMTGEAAPAGGGDQQDAQADRAIRNTLSSLVGEIRRSIQFFENQSRGMTVNRLVMGGGASNIQRLDSYLQKELNLPVEVIDPLLRIPVTGKNISPDALKQYRDMLSVSIGLALRKVLD